MKQFALIQVTVKNGGLFLIQAASCFPALQRLDPFDHFADNVNVIGRRRVVHRAFICVGFVPQHGGRTGKNCFGNQVFAVNGNDQTGRPRRKIINSSP